MSKVDIIKQNKKVAIIIATFIVILIVINVVQGTKVEPDDKNNLSYKMSAVNLIRLLDEYTEDYFNIKIALEKCA